MELESEDTRVNTDQNNDIKYKNLDIIKYKLKLQQDGYVVIPDVYTQSEIDEYKKEFFDWYNNVDNLIEFHDDVDNHGIFKYHQVGHQRFAWLARTNDKIINIFKTLWDTDELVTSFDGCCYYPDDYIDTPKYWTHTDQSSKKHGLYCYQSFLSITDNSQRTLIVYKGSHHLHQDYFNSMGIDSESDWNIIDQNYLEKIGHTKQILDVKKGDLVIWDSRTFHQNTCGSLTCEEERLVQYLCYLPKNATRNTCEQQEIRRNAFDNLRTTNHWPYLMATVPEQPMSYNFCNPDDPIFIDYESLPVPNLEDLKEKIEELL